MLTDTLPALQSMLDFPPVADGVQRSMLVWKALGSITGDLTTKTFIAAINETRSKQIATQQDEFHILTALSILPQGLPAMSKIDGATIRLLSSGYPKKYATRAELITRRSLPVEETPLDYCRVVVKVTAKSPYGAMTKALRAIDLQRAIWCLLSNQEMEIIGQEWSPINVIRLGSVHTIHKRDGSVASEDIWFEPSFARATTFKHEDPSILPRNSRYAFRKLASCSYRDVLSEALLRYVRALDERDQNTAFLRLWGAVESLASPDRANYDHVVRRCSSLLPDKEFHQQLLEHLREYRNQSVHAGDQSENAKTHCFQLQLYFRNLIIFHLRNAHFFASLAEANKFLDFQSDKSILIREKKLIEKAIRSAP